MIDRLRAFLNRPLRDSDRPRLFAMAVAVIVAVAAAFALLDDAGPTRAAAPPERRAAAPEPPAFLPEPPAERPTPPATRADIVHIKRAVRRFLGGYLPYTYGADRTIQGATAELRRRLARERPRVPAAERRRRPRLEHLQTEGATRRRAEAIAIVSDGARRYTVPLALSRTPAGWRVTSVGS
jgi:hypothetical protein